MKKSILLSILFVLVLTITPLKRADAVPPACGAWAPDATAAVNNGAHIVASNQTSAGTYVTVEIQCYEYPVITTSPPMLVTKQHVYFYPAPQPDYN